MNYIDTLGVIAATVAAYMAWLAADKTHKSTQAQLISSLLNEYGSDEMQEALVGLRKKWKENPTGYQKKFEEQKDVDPNWDRWRRRVSHYFHKVAVLYEDALLDRKYVARVATKEQVQFLLEVIEPLEAGNAKGYGPFMFNILGSLYE